MYGKVQSVRVGYSQLFINRHLNPPPKIICSSYLQKYSLLTRAVNENIKFKIDKDLISIIMIIVLSINQLNFII